jgi:hypothetical protein
MYCEHLLIFTVQWRTFNIEKQIRIYTFVKFILKFHNVTNHPCTIWLKKFKYIVRGNFQIGPHTKMYYTGPRHNETFLGTYMKRILSRHKMVLGGAQVF